MNALLMRTVHWLCLSAAMCLSMHTAMAQTATSRIVSAADNFLSTLDQTQRRNVLFAFDDEQQRVRWSNLPISSVRRAGTTHPRAARAGKRSVNASSESLPKIGRPRLRRRAGRTPSG